MSFQYRDNYKTEIKTDFPIINAVLNARQQGNIYTQASVFFILHKAGFGYLHQYTEDAAEALQELFLTEPSIPQYFHLYNAPETFQKHIEAHSDKFNYRMRKRIQLQYLLQSCQSGIEVSEEYSIKRIDLNNVSQLETLSLRPDIFWNSDDDFLANGYGFGAFDKKDKLASVCYTASVSDFKAEVDICTAEEHRNKGLASQVLSAFVQHSLKHNIVPNWDCFADNTASLKTAQRLGFTETFRYSFLSIYNKAIL